jgi:transcriptional antiterminator RfaH
MDFWRDINWFAIHAKNSREDVAATYVSLMGLEVFLPKIKQPAMVWGKPQFVLKPLFQNYLFARFCPAKYLHLVQYARGVRSVVSAGDLPLPVNDTDIGLIRDRISADGTIDMNPKRIQPGQKVAVKAGPLKGIHGVFEREINDRERVLLLLDAVHHHAHVLIEQRYLHQVAPVV